MCVCVCVKLSCVSIAACFILFTTFIRFCWFGFIRVWVSEMMRLCLCVCVFDRFNEEIEQVKKNKVAITKQWSTERNNWLFPDLKLDQSKLCVCWVNLFFYCSLRLPLAVYLFHFFILRVCLCWFGLLLLFVLFLYWYIMEEFELPWAIVSIITSCSILFCFWELLCGFVRICVCVCVGVF